MVLIYGQKNTNIDVFRELLNELQSSLRFTVEIKTNIYEKKINTFVHVLNFLDVFIILHQNGWLETDTFY